ncbi:peptidylprolyl isomerase [Flavobacterium croceum]|uniref:peptidylprolyl isomerase n=1 Tax=Flavobacterium croceum DSM 17960 TaxID=1121886 RepID=A0A2S4N9V0_9FLAO|nr:peptidylprolyl isomerase [Flavobacterium croceum]POS02481.1 cyclophilin family peptidyl-prolyl cis-trans isomerase [Flavobacterium croceum DSM 17960]
MKLKFLTLVILCASLSFAQTKKKKPVAKKTTTTVVKKTEPLEVKTMDDNGIFATIETNKGTIVLALEYKKTPITVANFISLAEGTNTAVEEKFKGKHFYDGLKFHRVIPNFMIQGGDPDGNGSGGPGYKFVDEITDLPHTGPGILSMANAGEGTNGSQFFITHVETPWLNGKHTVFGHVIKGQDVVNAIKQDDVINKITFERKGEDAKKFDASKVFADYMATKTDFDKNQAVKNAENRKKLEAITAEFQKKKAEAEAKKKAELSKQFAPVAAAKLAKLKAIKLTSTKTASGLQYSFTQKGNGKKPAEGATVYVHYAGYLEDGSLFDSSYESVNKEFGKYDANRGANNGYQPFPFQYGNKGGLIPGFLEGLNLMSFGDKAVFFIPSNLGYGEKGAGNVIPPNSNIIFEVELLETPPTK